MSIHGKHHTISISKGVDFKKNDLFLKLCFSSSSTPSDDVAASSQRWTRCRAVYLRDMYEPAIKIFSHARVFKSRTASLPKSHPKANSQAVVNQALLTQQTKRDLRRRVFQSANAIFGAQFSRLLIGSQLASRKRVWMGSAEEILRRWSWWNALGLFTAAVQKPCAEICAQQQAHKIHNGFMLYVHVSLIFLDSSSFAGILIRFTCNLALAAIPESKQIESESWNKGNINGCTMRGRRTWLLSPRSHSNRKLPCFFLSNES